MTTTTLETVTGGITAPRGYRASAVACGLKPAALDLALIVADTVATAAGVFTTNRTVAAPVVVSREQLVRSNGRARAIVVNSKCANACTGAAGLAAARTMVADTARALEIDPIHVLIASTGVIGMRLDTDKVARGIRDAAGRLRRDAHQAAAEAIMTTDVSPKERAVTVSGPTGPFTIGGMAKGAGMIEPHLATMLGFLTTDAAVESTLLARALRDVVGGTFNAITVDGEASTNDTVFLLANGASGTVIDESAYPALVEGLHAVSAWLAREIVRGGEGATKLVSVRVSGAASDAEAAQAARLIANSLLVKTALNGSDPNWGRIVAVAGRAGVAFDPERTMVAIGGVPLFSDGTVFHEREPAAAAHLAGAEVELHLDLGTGGSGTATIWTCDLSAEYVHINADYRT